MTGRCRGGARWNRMPRHAALALLVSGSTLLSAAGMAAFPPAAAAQEQVIPSEGEWVDPAASGEWTDIGESVDQAITDVWDDGAGEAWVEPAPVAAAAPMYDANGNMIDPATGVALAIGPDGTPIDAAAGLYF
ncbi:MAG: hypothetical protein ACRDJC_13320, partial [Thermomicrobiales bacterium]